jgi:glycosyltransferase involved in cell wall biosynthesis
MKILELCNFSAGGCGVFARVKREALLLKNLGYEVKIFSSNLEKGTNKIVPERDFYQDIEITRFPAKRLGGESFMRWNFKKSALEYSPDIIICHSYRHLHTLSAIKIAKKLNAKIFLVTHAPFARERGIINNIIVKLFDFLVGKKALKKYDKIIAITKWELPYLNELGISNEKIAYIPNGLTNEFFNKARKKEQNQIIFLGRISPIKDLSTIIRSLALLDNKNIKLKIHGPAEPQYLQELSSLVASLNLANRVAIVNEVYDSKQEIEELDSSKIFILASISEGMPQVLIEALSREKLVIASNNLGNADIISNQENGFLFRVGDSDDLASKIDYILSMNKSALAKIRKNARLKAEEFAWDKLIKKLTDLF